MAWARIGKGEMELRNLENKKGGWLVFFRGTCPTLVGLHRLQGWEKEQDTIARENKSNSLMEIINADENSGVAQDLLYPCF